MDPRHHRGLKHENRQESQSISDIGEQTAQFSLLRLISVQLHAAGFTHIQHKSLLEDLEGLLSGFLDGIIHEAYEMAQLCRRSRPNVRDMIAACVDQGVEIQSLNEMLSFKLVHDDYSNFKLPVIRSMNPGDPTLDFLPSDPESDEEHPNGDKTMKDRSDSKQRANSEKIGGLPHLPKLPAGHTWRYTALKPPPATVLPPKHLSYPSATPLPIPNLLHPEFLQTDEHDPNTPACLGFLNQRIRETRMVERSLTNLVQPNSLLSGKAEPILKNPQVNPDGSPPKFQVSETDVPVINFERDWYGGHLHSTKQITD